MHHVGILAYGSLIDNPGTEIKQVVVRRIENVETPFEVEFARQSSHREGAPTLVPVDMGGARVCSVILVLDEGITLQEAESILWRRETNLVGSAHPYDRPFTPGPNMVYVEHLKNFHDVSIVLYTKIEPNISNLTPETLAELAIRSAQGKAGAQGRDGISYLIAAKGNGIKTPLMEEYEREILNGVPANTLEEALRKLRPTPPGAPERGGSGSC